MDTGEYEEGIKGAGQSTSSFGDKLKKGLATAAKVGAAAIGAAATGIAALTKASIENYAEYEQLVGGVETLFKNSAGTVQEYAANAYKTAGMSANEYMSTVTSFSASLLQGLGGDTAEAARIADQAIIDMSDNANKMGTSMELIQNAYQGFAKQNYTMLDNLKLGYGGTQEEMIRLINDSGILNETISSLDNITFDQIIEAIHAVQENMGITGTTAEEASSTIQGSIASMKAAWTNFLTGMADPTQNFDALLGNLVDSVVTVSENLVPRILGLLPRLVEGITQLAQSLIPYIPPTIQSLLPALIDASTALFNGVVALLPSIITTAVQALPQLVEAAASIIGNLVSALIEALPQILDAGLQILDQLVTGIETGIPDMISRLPQVIEGFLNFMTENLGTILTKGVEILNSLITGIIQTIPQLVAALPQVITAFVNFVVANLPTIISAGIDILINLITGIIQTIPQLVAELPNIINAIVNGIKALMSSIINIGVDIVNGIKQGIANAWSALTSWVTSKFQSLVSSVKGMLGISSPSKVFAGIGENMAQGVGKGWDNEFDHIRRDIENGMNFDTGTVDFAASGVGMASAGIINSVGGAASGSGGGNITVNLVLPDGTALASYLLPNLANIAKANGTPILNPI